MAAAAVPAVLNITEQILRIANQVKILTDRGNSGEENEIAARVAELSVQIDQLQRTLDEVAAAVASLYEAIDASRQETLRITLWGWARAALVNIAAWRRHPQQSLVYIQPELSNLMSATQQVMAGVGLVGVSTMGLALAAHAAIFELLLKTDQKSLAAAMYKVSLNLFRNYFSDAADEAKSLGDGAQATKSRAEAMLQAYTLSVDRHQNAPPPGPYIPSEPRIWRGNCLQVWRLEGNLSTGFSVGGTKTWTRLNSIHTGHDPDACEANGNELGNDFPLTSLAEMNGLSATYRKANRTLELTGPSGQAATFLKEQTEKLIR